MNNNSKLLAALLVAGLAFAILPTSTTAATYNAGSLVAAPDADVTHVLAALIAPGGPYTAACYLDSNGNTKPDADEPVYLAIACGANFPAGTLRLSATSGKAAGTVMGGADADTTLGATSTPTAVNLLMMFDANGNGIYDSGDTVMLQLTAGAVAAIGDVQFGTGGITRITGTSAMFNKPMVATGMPAFGGATTFQFYDANADTKFGVSDYVYLSISGAATPQVNDVRLTAVGSNAAGSVVGPTDSDTQRPIAVPALPVGAFTNACFLDVNGNAGLDTDEPFYLMATACGANSAVAGDLRLGAYGGKNAGTIVGGADSESGKTFTGVVAAYCYFDANGNGIYDQGDNLYVHFITACAGNKVAVGDIQLNAAFARVTATSAGYNNPLIATGIPAIAGGGEKFYDINGDAKYTSMDVLYFDADAGCGCGGAGVPSVNDIRFTMFGSKAAGSEVMAGDFDATVAIGASAVFTTCYLDNNGNVLPDTDEPVILSKSGACAVAAGDIRLSDYGGKMAGTTILGGDAEVGKAWTALGGAIFEFFDANGDTLFDVGDSLYLSLLGGANVAVGDLQFGSGMVRVSGSTPGFNNPVLAAGGAYKFYDANGDGLPGTADAYYRSFGGGFPAVDDLRLTGVTSSQNNQGGGGTTTTTTTSGGVTTTSGTGGVTTTSGTGGVTTTSGGGGVTTTLPTTTPPPTTPGFELVALVGALAVALVLVRRKL